MTTQRELEQFLGELEPPTPFEAMSQSELAAKCYELQDKWLTEQKVGMEIAADFEQIQQENLQLLAAIALKDEAFEYASIGSCSCLTKTPNPEHHATLCKYRIIQKALAIQPDTTALAEYIEPLVKALEKLSYLGNGDKPGNSIGNQIAQAALRDFKGEQK